MDYTVHGILQAKILEWVAFPFSRKRTGVSCIAGGFFISWATREAHNLYSPTSKYTIPPDLGFHILGLNQSANCIVLQVFTIEKKKIPI